MGHWTEMHAEHETEQQILNCLARAWNKFVSLPITHPDDTDDFRRAIHQCQAIIATQKMRRIQPEVWKSFDGSNGYMEINYE